jgi:hypothetical protein
MKKGKLESWIEYLIIAGCLIYLVVQWKNQNDLRAHLSSLWILVGSMILSAQVRGLWSHEVKLRIVYISILLIISTMIFEDNIIAWKLLGVITGCFLVLGIIFRRMDKVS